MKRQKRAPRSQQKKTAKPPTSAPAPVTRRNVLARMAKTGLGIAVIGVGAGLLLTRKVAADSHEHDLDRIGKGVPMVVQVHDPQCPSCRSLQRQARKAMTAFDEDELQYAVASLEKADGRDLALRNGVGKVTLLLFDAKGKRRAVLRGEKSRDQLEQIFRTHAAGG